MATSHWGGRGGQYIAAYEGKGGSRVNLMIQRAFNGFVPCRVNFSERNFRLGKNEWNPANRKGFLRPFGPLSSWCRLHLNCRRRGVGNRREFVLDPPGSQVECDCMRALDRRIYCSHRPMAGTISTLRRCCSMIGLNSKLASVYGTIIIVIVGTVSYSTAGRSNADSGFSKPYSGATEINNDRVTVIHKNPIGPWPGGRLWLGVAPQSIERDEAAAETISIVIDPAHGIDI